MQKPTTATRPLTRLSGPSIPDRPPALFLIFGDYTLAKIACSIRCRNSISRRCECPCKGTQHGTGARICDDPDEDERNNATPAIPGFKWRPSTRVKLAAPAPLPMPKRQDLTGQLCLFFS